MSTQFERSLKTLAVITMICLAASTGATADPGVSKPAKAPIKNKTVVFGSLRVRPEDWQFFQPVKPGTSVDHYIFTGTQARLGVTGPIPAGSYTVEGADTLMLSLPQHSALAKPYGNLGVGANYKAASGTTINSLYLKQAFVTFHTPDQQTSITPGRFEFNDGTETKPSDPSLAWLQQNRIAQRLIGTFGYTDIGRSFDGARFASNPSGLNITAAAFVPTVGVFSLNNDNNDISAVHVGYLALSIPQRSPGAPSVARIFGLYYSDDRSGVTKSDNNTHATLGDVRIGTIGADYTRIVPAPCGKADVLLWGADQSGRWGKEYDSAYAYDLEGGYQPRNVGWNPWLRIGYDYSSGDDNPSDSDHNTFFPVLPTPRIYAQFPFYTNMNLEDAFVQVLLQPTPKASVRLDAHELHLASGKDLWYQGGGAFMETGNFGYAGTQTGGNSDLGALYDASLEYKLTAKSTLSLYYGYAVPSTAIEHLYTSHAGSLGFVQMNLVL
ncbi:MAG: alginate export family protein [Capsulimonadaceae bacterium]